MGKSNTAGKRRRRRMRKVRKNKKIKMMRNTRTGEMTRCSNQDDVMGHTSHAFPESTRQRGGRSRRGGRHWDACMEFGLPRISCLSDSDDESLQLTPVDFEHDIDNELLHV